MRIINTYREAVEPERQLTESEILELCCAKVGVDPCSEVGRVSDYDGADADHRNFNEDQALAAARAANPGKRILSVRAEGIGPPPGMPCGKKYETWEGQNNCCEGVTPLAWDMNVTPDVLPHNSSIIIAWTGGTGGETTITTSSNATFFDDGRRSITGYGSSVRLRSGETFCGATSVTVSDGCSEATVVIRSDQGHWVDRGPVCGNIGGNPEQSGYTWTKINGKYKQVEVVVVAMNGPYSWGCPVKFCSDLIPVDTGDCLTGPNCAQRYCDHVTAYRTASAKTDVCDLSIDYGMAYHGGYVCAIEPGVYVYYYGDSTFYCYPYSFGSTGLLRGVTARSESLTLYEWSC
jgi:hypothetical protein